MTGWTLPEPCSARIALATHGQNLAEVPLLFGPPLLFPIARIERRPVVDRAREPSEPGWHRPLAAGGSGYVADRVRELHRPARGVRRAARGGTVRAVGQRTRLVHPRGRTSQAGAETRRRARDRCGARAVAGVLAGGGRRRARRSRAARGHAHHRGAARRGAAAPGRRADQRQGGAARRLERRRPRARQRRRRCRPRVLSRLRDDVGPGSGGSYEFDVVVPTPTPPGDDDVLFDGHRPAAFARAVRPLG